MISKGCIRFLKKTYRGQSNSSNFQIKNYLNYLGDFMGQMALVSPPSWMANGAIKSKLGQMGFRKGLFEIGIRGYKNHVGPDTIL